MNKDGIIFENIVKYLLIYIICSGLAGYFIILTGNNIDYNLMYIIASVLFTLSIFYLFKHRNMNIFKYCCFTRISLMELFLSILIGIAFEMVFEMINSVMNLYRYFPDYNKYQELFTKIIKGNFFIVLLSIVIIGPILEEIIFRGLIFKELRKGMSISTSIILQSTIFAIIHGSIYQGFYAFILGILLSVMFYLSKSIWVPIIIHMASNMVALFGSLFIKTNINSAKEVIFIFVGITILILSFKYFYYQREKQRGINI
ncbi:CPBP family intramembrane metalloprotease [Aceticella autotrophica]|uniref:CPBP family intramembrane metalloprotease n=1 Tax=Aceticella autotrophica TaxID=2755338 RepID=A0A974Y751_9THEO|nr:type II CAAX endopeptidase family protein [Aceticella autotrophica]QSZ26468.1 CPBP family intramembrane metalloprotease [Aceticella autotrophica]